MISRKRKAMKICLAALCAASMLLLTGCGGNDEEENPVVTSADTTAEQTVIADPLGGEDDDITVYTGKQVENEEDLAIYKISFDLPEGYTTTIDNAEGKQYLSDNGQVVVKAQNFKEEFQDLAVFADQGCAGIKLNNMLFQADTEFSEPINTTVAGFDAIRYDYTITSYQFDFELDENGEPVLDENGDRIVTDKRVIGEFVDRIYYFYSDEDVFYIICEASKDKAEAAAAEFDSIIASAKIS